MNEVHRVRPHPQPNNPTPTPNTASPLKIAIGRTKDNAHSGHQKQCLHQTLLSARQTNRNA